MPVGILLRLSLTLSMNSDPLLVIFRLAFGEKIKTFRVALEKQSLVRRLFIFSLFTFHSSLFTFGQGDLRIGQWTEHLPYNGGATVTQSPTRVYYGSQFALIAILKEDTSQVEFFSKVTDSAMLTIWIRYHETYKTLIIGYSNGEYRSHGYQWGIQCQ